MAKPAQRTIYHELPVWLLTHLDHPSLGALYGILDGTTGAPLIGDFFRHAGDADYQPLFLHTPYVNCLPYSPYLVRFSSRHAHYLENSTSLNLHQDSIWFNSHQDLDNLASHWRRLTEINIETGKTVQFRYWSGKVLHSYLASMAQREQQQVLPPLSTILTPIASGYGWEQRSFAQEAPSFPPQPCAVKFHHQEQAFYKSVSADVLQQSVTDKLWRLCPQAMERLHPSLISDQVKKGINAAKAKTIKNEDAMAKFIHCQLALHPEFWRHTALTPIWECDNSEEEFGKFYQINMSQ